MGQARRKAEKSRAPLLLDPWILASALMLAALGIIMITSASLAIAENQGIHPLFYAFKHVVALTLGTLLALICLRLPLANLEKASPLLMLLCFPALMVVFVPGFGVTVNGATRWVRTGLLNFQVVEAVKIMLAIYLAGYAVRHSEALRSRFLGSVKPLGVACVMATLLLAQPDFGGAVLLLGMTGAVIWQAGARFRDLGALALFLLPVGIWVAMSESYRLQRLVSFLDPWADPYSGGFQLTQALIAVGRGEWLGVGLGGSVQKLFYLPEAHTDFILAVLAEELGLIGVLVVMVLFAVLVVRGLIIAMQALHNGQYFAGYLAYGLSFVIGLQALVSIGVNFGVLPTKGLTLPLVSSGGSSALMSCVMLGLLLRVAHEVASEGGGVRTMSDGKSPRAPKTRRRARA
ncbi:MAG: putative lipid II flippase FtsW [Pseudomonadota bacterium]